MARKIYSVPHDERVDHVASLIGSNGYRVSPSQPWVDVEVQLGRQTALTRHRIGRAVGCAMSNNGTSPDVLVLNQGASGIVCLSLATVATITPIEEPE